MNVFLFILGAISAADVGLLLASSKKVEGFCSTLLQQQKKTMAEISELKQMVEKLQKQGFTIKGSSYEVMVHACNSITYLYTPIHAYDACQPFLSQYTL